MENLGRADHDITSLQNIYHRYIKLPFEFIKPSVNDIKKTFSDEQKNKSSVWDTLNNVKTDFYKFKLPELDEKITSFLETFNLFYSTKLLFFTGPHERINIHVDSNKDANYLNETSDYFDNHAKLNFTWENENSSLQWWKTDDNNNLKVDTHTYEGGKTWKVIWAEENKCQMVYEKKINKPSIVNTGVLHSTHNPSDKERITLSYNLVRKQDLRLLTFFEALWIFGDLLYE